MTGQPVQGAAAFGKFVRVLQTIADAGEAPDMAALARSVPYPRPTLYRIVAALAAEGFVRETAEGGFRLGPRLVGLAGRALEQDDLRRLAAEHLAGLRDATGETVHLAVPSGTEMVYVDKLESPRTVRMGSRIGTRVALHSTSVGKAYLAALDPASRELLLSRLTLDARTATTLTGRSALDADIATTARRGYAVDREENELDIVCFGAAICGRNGAPLGAVSVSIPKYRLDADAEREHPARLVAAVAAIARAT